MNTLKVDLEKMVIDLKNHMNDYKATSYIDEITTVVEVATEIVIDNICGLTDTEILSEFLNFMIQFRWRSHEQLTSRVFNMTSAITRFYGGEEDALREELSSVLAFWLELEYRSRGVENVAV